MRKKQRTREDRPFCRPIYGLKGSEYPYLVLPLVSAGKRVPCVMKGLFSVRAYCMSRTVVHGGSLVRLILKLVGGGGESCCY